MFLLPITLAVDKRMRYDELCCNPDSVQAAGAALGLNEPERKS